MIYGFDLKNDYWDVCFSQQLSFCNGSEQFWSTFNNHNNIALLKSDLGSFREAINLVEKSKKISKKDNPFLSTFKA
jgi:hypothetical protein